MREYFPKPKSLGGRVKVEYYTTKADLKHETGVDASIFAKKLN